MNLGPQFIAASSILSEADGGALSIWLYGLKDSMGSLDQVNFSTVGVLFRVYWDRCSFVYN